MTALILGANSSGKSAYAEDLIERLSLGCPLYYIATMVPHGAEGESRVLRHQKQRRGKGYITIEAPMGLSGIMLPAEAGVLLEDVSNLLANRMFGGNEASCEECVMEEITTLSRACCNIVIVSISGGTLDGDYAGETAAYIATLRQVNAQLTAAADLVIEMRDGEPVLQKGASI